MAPRPLRLPPPPYLIIGLAVLLAITVACSRKQPAAGVASAQKTELSTTTLMYLASDRAADGDEQGHCGTPMHVLVVQPEGGGPHPVFVFVTGSWGSYQAPHVRAILDGAARQGFVAASVEYDDRLLPLVCSHGWHKTRCMFSTSFNPESALGTICKLSQADCNAHGVVVAGHSQGGAHAAMARNFDTRVRGAWTMGFGSGHESQCTMFGMAPFGSAERRLLRNDRLRVFRGGHEGAPIASSNDATGRACPPGTTNCLIGPNASGWETPGDDERTAVLNPNRHCFMEANPLLPDGQKIDCNDSAPHNIDPKFAAEPPAKTYSSGLYANIRWLKEIVLPLGPQP